MLMRCEVPQGSIFDPLFVVFCKHNSKAATSVFLVYVDNSALMNVHQDKRVAMCHSAVTPPKR